MNNTGKAIMTTGAVAFFGLTVWLITLGQDMGASFAGTASFGMFIAAAVSWGSRP